MKRIILLAAAVMLLLPLRAQQPEDGVARHAVKFNLLSPIASSIDFSWHSLITRHSPPPYMNAYPARAFLLPCAAAAKLLHR